MKKTSLSFFIAILMVFSVMKFVNAATYGLSKTGTVSVGGTTAQVGEKATYYSSGDTRWTYSNKSLKVTGGKIPANISSTASTVKIDTSDGTFKTGRKHTVRVTTTNYLDYTSSHQLTWTFYPNTNTLK